VTIYINLSVMQILKTGKEHVMFLRLLAKYPKTLVLKPKAKEDNNVFQKMKDRDMKVDGETTPSSRVGEDLPVEEHIEL
jgi:hypothetical protein